MNIEEYAKELGMRKGQLIENFIEWVHQERKVDDIFYVSDEVFDKLIRLWYNELKSGLKD